GFDQRDARVLPDMGVKVSFITDEPASATTSLVEVPKNAVRRDGEQDVVYVVKDGKAERRAVRVTTTQGEKVRIASGVSADEPVVIAGPDLADGESVRVKK